MPPYGGRASKRAVCPFRRGVASSEAESVRSLEGRLTTLERSGNIRRLSRVPTGGPQARWRLPRGFEGARRGRTVYMGCGLGFFESFPFLRIWKEAVGLRGPCFAFLGRFSPLIRVPLIMVPDNIALNVNMYHGKCMSNIYCTAILREPPSV